MKIKTYIAICAATLMLGLFLAMNISSAGGGAITGKIKAKGKKARNIVVYVEEKASPKVPAKHPVMDQKNLVFLPHVLPVPVGTTVDFLNSDNVRHNVFSPDGKKFNLGTWPQGKTKSFTFKKAGVYTLLCNVHPEMEGYIVVLKSSHYAVSGKDGSFSIKGIPDGTYTLKTWSPHTKKSKTVQVTVSGGKADPVEIAF